ncbi:MAG: DEAD/DEAH box helicase [Candidatus Zixiibacteriota bacterium]
MTTFSDYAFHRDIQRGINDMGYTAPTPIQQDTIHPALDGRDILACAMTGSGKTAAFVLPILQQLHGRKRRTTRALILTPTRELAAQIDEHIEGLARHTSITSASVFGGASMDTQKKAIRRGVDILVATPGRLLDHFQYPYARLRDLEILVIDEADRMLDMGFLPDVRRILDHLPTPKQTLFFSATLPAPIVSLSREMLDNPATINIDRTSAPADGVTQSVYPANGPDKSELLLELLNRGSLGNALVFTRTKHRANRLAMFLQRNGVACERLHGNRSQNQRTEALAGFKSGRFRVLVATDIAARGIDVTALSHVVNFDVPDVPESYIHRVGRTARADMTGDALTFVSAEEESTFRAIERALGTTIPRIQLEGFAYTAGIPKRKPAKNGRRNVMTKRISVRGGSGAPHRRFRPAIANDHDNTTGKNHTERHRGTRTATEVAVPQRSRVRNSRRPRRMAASA